MMVMDIDEHVLDDLPAYTLDILDEDEMLRVERHLGLCESCREEWQFDQQVMDMLPLAAPLVEPPASLKASILESAEKESTDSTPAVPPEVESARPGLFQRLMPVWAVASLALIFLLVGANLFFWNQLREVRGSIQSTLQVVSLNGTETRPDATGLMVVGGDGLVGTLIVDNLPVLDKDFEYQLWLLGEEGRDDGGVFSVSDDGYGLKYIHSERPLLSYKGFGITIEPAGGSAWPTGEKVLGIDF
jgi:hypothetical protein